MGRWPKVALRVRVTRLALFGFLLTVTTAGVLILLTRSSQPPEIVPNIAAASGPKGNPDRPNILLISVDTLRADHLGLYGYERSTSPRIDEWFARGRVYERAYSTEASTSPSVVSMLTGMLPQEHGVRLHYQRLAADVVTVPQMLGASDYQTAAIVSNIVLTSEAMGLDRHFDYYDDFVDEKSYRAIYERGARPTTDAAIRWLDLHADLERPHFLWLHYIDPHGPYRPPPFKPTEFSHAVELKIDAHRVPRYQHEPGVRDGREYIDRYDEEIAYTDREIGRLLDEYVSRGLAENTLVIFTADHGESMMEHERWFTHGYQVYEEIIRVPLAITGPGIGALRVSEPVSNMDVAPTILAAARFDLPKALAKRVLDESPGLRNVYSEATHRGQAQWRSQVRGQQKWMMSIDGESGRVLERWRYDLGADPGETHILPWADGDEFELALVEISSRDPDTAGVPAFFNHGTRIKAPKVAPGLDAETLEKLRGLGYVED